MASVTRLPAYPNVLLVTGSDVMEPDYRLKLRTLLNSAPSTTAVRRGTHDFWITYYQPTIGVPSEAGVGYADAAASPHPLKAVVFMDRLGDPPDAQIDTLLQEVGHRWLVPSDLTVGGVAPMRSGEFTDVVNRDGSLNRPLLLGRGDSHWSTYLQGDASPLDGMGWARGGSDDGLARWDQRATPVPAISRAGLPDLAHGQTYSDLDLLLMGVKRPDEAYASTGGLFYWIEPRVVAPLDYHIGLFVAFSRTDYIYFGFYQDPRTLAAERTARWGRTTADVGLGHRPFSQDFGAMMLRVVRRGGRFYLQARNGNSTIGGWQALGTLFGGPAPTTAPTMFDQLDRPLDATGAADFTDFRTVAVFDEPNAQPQAVGILVKTWSPILAEGTFFSFELRDGMQDVALPPMNYARPLAPGTPYGELRSGDLWKDQPFPGSWLRFRSLRMVLGTPYQDNYDHWATMDRAPKILTRAPAGDFVFGTSAKVRRSLVSPWAAGAASGKSIWGNERSASALDVVPSSASRQQQVSLPATLKAAFVIVAPTREQITDSMVQSVDKTRQYWEAVVQQATSDRVWFDTRL